jgi:8-oxo-dGTP pyrophosphatase MutT (NUDIX family)
MACTTMKIAAFITRERAGCVELLAFNHPEADYFTRNAPLPWLQLPAGTGEAGETPLQAALREVQEESGLTEFVSVDYLGACDDQPWGIRHVFHMRVAGNPPECWTHTVRCTGGSGWDEGMVFHYAWLRLSEAAGPIGMFAAWLPMVEAFLSQQQAAAQVAVRAIRRGAP